MTDIVVVGTGGMGREALAWIEACGRAPQVVGLLDDDPARHGAEIAGHRVVGGLDWLDGRHGVEVVLAVGAPAARAALADRLSSADVPLVTLVHPRATVGPRVTLGEGSIICPGALLTCDIEVGRAVIVNYGAMVGHDGVIGDGAFIAPGVHLAGAVTIGPRADIGIGACIIQEVSVGERAVVGAGAVVVRDVAADTTVMGVPARPRARSAPRSGDATSREVRLSSA